MIAGKQSATLDRWQAVPDEENPQFFIGAVHNHPHQEDFTKARQQTSPVVSFDAANGILETRNTIYRLGYRYAGVDPFND